MRYPTEAIRSSPARRLLVLGLGVALGVFACRGGGGPTAVTRPSPVAGAAARFAQAAAAVTGQKAELADDYEKGRHVGFDTHTYPGIKVMRIWKETPGSPYKWVGFYLPAPCHKDTSWVGTRDSLDAMGWGMAVVYVGQQTWGRTPRTLSSAERDALRENDPCNANLLSAEEGRRDADDAVKRTEAEGFTKGAVVFLDLERMDKIPEAMRDYYRAWVERMLETKQYRPGIYAHRHNAEQIYGDVNALFKAAGIDEQPRFWIAGGKEFHEGRAPQDVGFAFAGVWQGLLDVARSVAEVKLPIDVNVAAWRSPSESGLTQ